MSSLKTLTLLQMKDKVDFSCFKDFKQAMFKIVFSILKFGIIAGLIFLAFYFVSFLRLTSLQEGIPSSVISIIFALMILLSIFVCTLGLTKGLYFATDNQLLLTMPTNRINIFLSKLIVYTIYEYVRNIFYILPLLFAYGLVNGMPITFYLWLPFANLLITLFTVAVGSLLSIPGLFLAMLVKKDKTLEYVTITALVVGFVWLAIAIINVIPANIDIVASWSTLFWDIQNALDSYMVNCAFIYDFSTAFTGTRYGTINTFFDLQQFLNILLVLGITIGILGLTLLLVRPLFFKMASKPFEYTRTLNIRSKENKARSPFWGSVKKEFTMIYRTNGKFNDIILTAVLLPLGILLLNKITGAMDTRITGTYMAMTFNVLLILLVSLSSNAMASKTFSEEGDAGYLNKTIPSNFARILTSKLMIPMICTLCSILASVIIFAKFSNLTVMNTIVMFLTTAGIYLGHMFYSASLDVMNPQNSEYATTGSHNNNPNETKSTITGFILSAVIALIYYFLITENSAVVWTKILFIATLYFAWNLFMYLSKIKVYYKEK